MTDHSTEEARLTAGLAESLGRLLAAQLDSVERRHQEALAQAKAERICPATLRAEAQRRADRGYVHHGTVRNLMRRLADHMEAMSQYGSGDDDSTIRPAAPTGGDA